MKNLNLFILAAALFLFKESQAQTFFAFNPCKEENRNYQYVGTTQGLSISWKVSGGVGQCELDWKVVNDNNYDVCLSATVIWNGTNGESQTLSTTQTCMNCNCTQGEVLVKAHATASDGWGGVFGRPASFASTLSQVSLTINSVTKHESAEDIKKKEAEEKRKAEQDAQRQKDEQKKQEDYQRKQQEQQDKLQRHANELEEQNRRIQDAQQKQGETFLQMTNVDMTPAKYHGQITFSAGYGGYSIDRHNAFNIGPNVTSEDLWTAGNGWVFQGSLENTFYTKNKRLGFDLGLIIKQDLGVCSEDPELDSDGYQRSPEFVNIEPRLILWIIGKDGYYKFGFGVAHRGYKLNFDESENDDSPHEYGLTGLNLILPLGIDLNDKRQDIRLVFGDYFGSFNDQTKINQGSVSMLSGKLQVGYSYGYFELCVDKLSMSNNWVLTAPNSWAQQSFFVYSLGFGLRVPW